MSSLRETRGAPQFKVPASEPQVLTPVNLTVSPVNLVLFEAAELASPLARTDPRAQHILKVLRRDVGDPLDVGHVNGPRGKATLTHLDAEALHFTFAWDPPLAPLPPTILLIGLPRPQTARDILRDATTLGATALHFIATERADPNYATSSLWTSGEWRRHCLTGAAQAFDTRIPEVTWTHSLASALAVLPQPESETSLTPMAAASRVARFALDNYEATSALESCIRLGTTAHEKISATTLAFGPERGFGPTDRAALRKADFTLAHLGSRVLRVETAIVAALAITRLR
jgi:16S rRNA (uracil1498-N3)-methyltransferase